MCENKNSVLADVITPISNAIKQNIPNTASETDGALSTVVGFFNNVVLYPVKKANPTYPRRKFTGSAYSDCRPSVGIFEIYI